MKTNLNKLLSLAIVLLTAGTLHAQTWNLTGNAGTIPGTNFIGTTDLKALYLKTNSNTRIAVTSSGKVGIGTTAPTAKLQVEGLANASEVFRISNDKNTTKDSIMVMTSSGNVGIGTTAPISKLDIASSGANGLVLNTSLSDPTSSSRIFLKNSTSVNSIFNVNGSIGFFTGATVGNTSGVEKMRIDPLGNVGIGTSSPHYPLEILSDANTQLHFLVPPGGPYYTSIGFGYNGIGDNTCARIDLGFESLSGNSNSFLAFRTGQSPYAGNADISLERLRITSGGDVGIGTSVPGYKLDVCGVIRATEVRVAAGWCDYVFADNYKLPSLNAVEAYINVNKHLPGVTAASVIESEGLEVGKVSSEMIKKIEELTLYAIQQQKQIDALTAKINSLVEKGGK